MAGYIWFDGYGISSAGARLDRLVDMGQFGWFHGI